MQKKDLKEENKLLRSQLRAEQKKNVILEKRVQALTESYAAHNLEEDLTSMLNETREIKKKYTQAVKEARVLIKDYSEKMEKLTTELKNRKE